MRLLFIGYNYKPEPTGIGKYTGEMVEWLAKAGHECTIITTYPYYPYWKVQQPYEKHKFWYSKEKQEFESGGSIKVYRCPMYVPEKPSGLKRVLLDFSFFTSAFFQLLKLMGYSKFDYIMCIVPSFQLGLLGVFYKKLEGGKLIYHIQDLQIEAARDFKMINSEFAINTMFRIEKYIFKNADVVSSISEGMNLRISKKAGKPAYRLPNWTDTKFFRPIPSPDKLKEQFGFKAEDRIILYSGAIGEKQGLETIIIAANKMREEKKIHFIICGTGPYKTNLESQSSSLGLRNVHFFRLQPMEKFNEFLNMADIHLVIQKAKASDLVMPSKLTTILGVGGLALVTAEPQTTLYQVISEHKMGILIAPEDDKAFLLGIQKALAIDRKSDIHRNAREYAEKNLSVDSIMTDFQEIVLT